MQSPLLTTARAAKRCGVTSAWLQAEADARRVPCLPAGGKRYLFDPDALLTALQERARRPVSYGEVAHA